MINADTSVKENLITESAMNDDAITVAVAAAYPDLPETVMIGGKKWMNRNLNVKTDSSWCFRDDTTNCDKYGRLYTWKIAVKACAALGNGWRLPNNDDWESLIDATGDYNTAGTKLKSKTGWLSGTEFKDIPIGSDDFGFSALPGGQRADDNIGYDAGNWWSASVHTAKYGDAAYFWYIQPNDETLSSYYHSMDAGYSVRCIHDD